MGSFISKGVGGVMENMKEQQQTMKLYGATLIEVKYTAVAGYNQMERQIVLQNEMRQRGVATQIAFSREMFMWWGSFYAVVSFGAVMAFLKTKKPAVLVPIVPLSFMVGYQADFAYGTKITRVRAEAESILQNEGNLLNLPLGRPTIELIDEKRKN